jgi:hypothetical protein
VQLQFTPALAESFVTVAAICVVLGCAVVEAAIVAGGGVEMETPMGGGAGAVMLT